MMSSNWQYQLQTIAERARTILQTGIWSDCTFVVGIGDNQKEFKAHKLILSMSSAVFDKMLNGPMKEEDVNKIGIVDIQPEAFSSLLKYIYTDEIELQSFDQACELCYVANKYMLPNLVQNCMAYIWRDINVSNACRAYEFANLFDQHDVAEQCKKIILEKTSDIIEHQSFIDIEKNTLLMILSQDQLSLDSEKQLFDAVERWIEAEFLRQDVADENQKKQMHNEIISNIRFLSMSPQEFAEGPVASPYFSKEDSFAILMNIVTPSASIRLPKNFSEKKRILQRYIKQQGDISWELKFPAEMEVSSQTEYAILISCNRDIEIFGIKVIGNLVGQVDELEKAEPHLISRSEERISGFIENLNSTSSECVIEKHSQGLREYFYLMFCKPYTMTQGKFYKVGVKILKSGSYTAGIFDYDSLLYKSLKFEFQKTEIEELSYICGIICRAKSQD